ncbi:unnamed protein product [Ectocarpus sp. 13 AM-2016]
MKIESGSEGFLNSSNIKSQSLCKVEKLRFSIFLFHVKTYNSCLNSRLEKFQISAGGRASGITKTLSTNRLITKRHELRTDGAHEGHRAFDSHDGPMPAACQARVPKM